MLIKASILRSLGF